MQDILHAQACLVLHAAFQLHHGGTSAIITPSRRTLYGGRALVLQQPDSRALLGVLVRLNRQKVQPAAQVALQADVSLFLRNPKPLTPKSRKSDLM